MLTGLVDRAELNGLTGECVGYDESSGRYPLAPAAYHVITIDIKSAFILLYMIRLRYLIHMAGTCLTSTASGRHYPCYLETSARWTLLSLK